MLSNFAPNSVTFIPIHLFILERRDRYMKMSVDQPRLNADNHPLNLKICKCRNDGRLHVILYKRSVEKAITSAILGAMIVWILALPYHGYITYICGFSILCHGAIYVCTIPVIYVLVLLLIVVYTRHLLRDTGLNARLFRDEEVSGSVTD